MIRSYRAITAIIIGAFLLSIPQATVSGQYYRDHGDDEEGPGVILYKHADFRGSHTFVRAGKNVRNLQRIGWNDKISSIELVDNVYIKIYEHANYQGASVTVRRDIIDLAEFGKGIGGVWNDKISSIKVYYGSGYDDDSGYGRSACMFYKHSNRRGSSYEGRKGRHRKISSSWNDEISSVWIRSGYKLTLYEHKSYGGRRLTLYGKGRRGSFYNLKDYRFNDKMSSYKLERTRRRRW